MNFFSLLFSGAFIRFGGEYCYECLFKIPGANDLVPELVTKQEEG